jgi:hypothetical protein
MTEQKQDKTRPAFRAPGTTEWRVLSADGESDKERQDEVRKARDELKNMLLASLKMQHLVALAGLGCSLSAGGPSMQDLWNGAVGEKPTDEAKATAKKVNHKLTDANIEALLSRIEAFLQVNEGDTAVEGFLNSSKQVILNKCSAFLDPGKLDPHKAFLHRLSRRHVRDQRLRVFTTNYDLCFERAASELGGVALDGFSFTAPRRYDPRFFAYDIIRRRRSGDDLGNFLEGVFLLYKLHGSVNWARGEAGAIHEKPKPTPAEACLIYPASGKYQQSFVQPHLESMAQYLAAVREPHLRLIIVDPGADEKVKDASGNRFWTQFFELGGRGEDVWFIKASFEDFAQMIPDLKSLPPADALMKAIKGVTRET